MVYINNLLDYLFVQNAGRHLVRSQKIFSSKIFSSMYRCDVYTGLERVGVKKEVSRPYCT